MDRSRGQTADRLLPDPQSASNVTHNPDRSRLYELAAPEGERTAFGSIAFRSAVRSRSADQTKNALDDPFDQADEELMRAAFRAVGEREMLCIDRQMGRHAPHNYVCRYFVPREYARIALSLAQLLEPAPAGVPPDFITVQLPDHDRTAIRIDPERGLTAVLGTDYTGEAKKSFLRLFMYHVKRAGGLGLHAGSKRIRLRTNEGPLETVTQLFLGLSATGKSTLTAHGYFLEGPEHTTVVQDDVCGLLPDGTVVGSEGEGMYVKTAGLDPAIQPALYEAVTHESTVLENVVVEADGAVDLDADRYTANGRASIRRDVLTSADPDIDIYHVDQLFFITRNPVMPPVAKLDPDEAAAAFMLGESIETSAGDPDRAGEAVRVVGTNPFIIGPPGDEGNRFRELVARNDIDCYVLNTGELGDGGRDIRVEDTVTLLREIARGRVTWTESPESGLTVPEAVPGFDVEAFRVEDYVPNLETRLRELRAERRSYLEGFDHLDPAIVEAVY
ncbi:MAG: phosphoenolpyruvate carboxykinase (ATP) [Halobacteriota archaeon]